MSQIIEFEFVARLKRVWIWFLVWHVKKPFSFSLTAKNNWEKTLTVTYCRLIYFNVYFLFVLRRVPQASERVGHSPGHHPCHPPHWPRTAPHLEAARHHPRQARVRKVREGEAERQVGHGRFGWGEKC